PLSCTTDADAASMMVKFKAFGETKWNKLTMTKVGETFQVTIPCDATNNPGPLSYYVGAKDAAKKWVDQYGSKKKSASFEIIETDEPEALSFPGGQPVERCISKVDCPPDFPGCTPAEKKKCGEIDWGGACNNSTECACGLTCANGTCESAPSCTADSDCDTGACVDGYCGVPADTPDEPAGPYKKHWVNVSVGLDIGVMGIDNACNPIRFNENGYQCFDSSGEQYFDNNIDAGEQVDDVGTGLAGGQLRIKLGYDYAFTDHILAGAKLGIGFLNSPPKGFVPVTFEARGTYVFTSLSKTGLRPAIYLAAGYGEGAARAQNTVPTKGPDGNLNGGTAAVYRVGGSAMVAPGASLTYAIKPEMGVTLDVQASLYLPAGGLYFALTPTLAGFYAF
ncbi:MAG: hypothetical protein MK135_15250, partial [Polyangiaceae bacterium]|nr:hypothetical protein [Polyangiaceae bacterium]